MGILQNVVSMIELASWRLTQWIMAEAFVDLLQLRCHSYVPEQQEQPAGCGATLLKSPNPHVNFCRCSLKHAAEP